MTIKIHTIGFTQKSAERFFDALAAAGVRQVVDTRLHNTSQLSGFAKREDLRYFLQEIVSIDYSHEPLFAPEEATLFAYRKKQISWQEYERSFKSLLNVRKVEKVIDPHALNETCLLCSESEPRFCHRRLVADYLREAWSGVEIHHIV